MFKGNGKLVFDPYRGDMRKKTKGWAVIVVDREITRYFRYFIEKNPVAFGETDIVTHQPSWDAHISVIRGECSNHPDWGKFNNEVIEFDYEILIKRTENGSFFFVDVFSDRIQEIRDHFGLKTFFKYHLTVARVYQEDYTWIDRVPKTWHL